MIYERVWHANTSACDRVCEWKRLVDAVFFLFVFVESVARKFKNLR